MKILVTGGAGFYRRPSGGHTDRGKPSGDDCLYFGLLCQNFLINEVESLLIR